MWWFPPAVHSPLSPAAPRVSSKEPSCQVHSTGAAEQRNDGTSRHGEGPCHARMWSIGCETRGGQWFIACDLEETSKVQFFPISQGFLQDQRISPFVKLAANQADPVTCTFCSTQSSFPRSESTFNTTPSPWRKVNFETFNNKKDALVTFQKQDVIFCLDSPRCKVPSVHFLHPQSAATPDHRLVPCVVEFTDIPIATNSVRRDSHHGLFSSHMISVKLQIPKIQEFGVLLRPSIFYLPHLQTWTPRCLNFLRNSFQLLGTHLRHPGEGQAKR